MANTIVPINTNAITKINPLSVAKNLNTESVSNDNAKSFMDYLNEAIGQVNNLQIQAKNAEEQLATGQIDDVSSVMIASEKASLSLQYALAIRNKVMDAYNEIMRMPV